MGKKVFGEASLRTLLADLKTQFDSKADLADGKLATAQMPPISWNDLQDRPFGETYTVQPIDLVWPADTTDLITVSGDSLTFYRVSDALSAEELLGATVEIVMHSNGADETQSLDCTASNIEVTTTYVTAPTLCSILSPNTTVKGATFNVPGTYVAQWIIGEDEYMRFDRLTKAGGAFVTKLSYNDLADTPCSLHTIAGYSFSLPQDIDSVDHISVEKDMEIDHDTMHAAIQYCRVGDMLTLDQLTGCTADMEFSTTDGDSGTQTQAVNPDADDFVVQATHISLYDGLLLSVFSDNTDIDGATFNSGTYLSSVVMYDSNGAALMTNTLRTIRKDDTVEAHQIDKDLVPDISELNGVLSSDKVPSLDELRGLLPADRLQGRLSADHVPTLSDMEGKIDLDQIDGALTPTWADLVGKPSGTRIVITPDDIDWSLYHTLPDPYARCTYFYAGNNLSLEQLQSARITHSSTASEHNTFSSGASVYTYTSSLNCNTSDLSGGSVVRYRDLDDDNDAILWFSVPGTFRDCAFTQGLWVREDWCFNFWLYSAAEEYDHDDYNRMYAPQWVDVSGKPFGEIKRTELYHITSFDTNESFVRDGSSVYYRVCDYLLPETLEHAVLCVQNGQTRDDRQSILLSSQYKHNYGSGCYWSINDVIYLISISGTADVGSVSFPSAGVWVLGWQDAPYVDLVKYTNATQTLGREYLPSTAILPVVTAADNGKVLKVQNGAWSVGSGGGQFVVTFSDVDIENMTIGLPDKSGEEIHAALQANTPVVASLAGAIYLSLIQQNYESATAFSFIFAAAAGAGLLAVSYDYDSSEKTGINLMIPASYTELQALAPLIVTLTLDGTGETPVLRGSETYGAIKDAQFAGKHVILKGSLEGKGNFAASVVDAVYDAEENEVTITYASAGRLAVTGGLASDYFTVAAE